MKWGCDSDGTATKPSKSWRGSVITGRFQKECWAGICHNAIILVEKLAEKATRTSKSVPSLLSTKIIQKIRWRKNSVFCCLPVVSNHAFICSPADFKDLVKASCISSVAESFNFPKRVLHTGSTNNVTTWPRHPWHFTGKERPMMASSRSNCNNMRFEKIGFDRKRLMICANARLGVGRWCRKIRHKQKKTVCLRIWVTSKSLHGCLTGSRNILSTHVVSQCCQGSCHILQSAPCSLLSAWRGKASSSVERSHLLFNCQTCRCSVASSLVFWKNYLAK